MKTITGIVEAVSQKEKTYGVKVKAKEMDEGIWINGFGVIPGGIEQGTVVTVEYEDKKGHQGIFHNIKKIDIIEVAGNAKQAALPEDKGKPTAAPAKEQPAPKEIPEGIQTAITNVFKIKMDCAAVIASVMQGNVDSPQKSDMYFRNIGRLFKWIIAPPEEMP